MTHFAGPALVCGAYLLGSISFGLVVAARHGVDLRAVGSGNVGATNVGRALGRRAMALVLVLDALKGLVPVLVARLWLGPDDPWTAGVAVAAVIGHCVPVWHRFRGGKGAATAAGVMLALVPWAGLAFAVTYALLRKVTRRSSVGSLSGAVVAVAVTGWLEWMTPAFAASGVIAVLVWIRHADNLARLARGEEPAS
jgi:glycerol-3-phosphate acyltransferase PlsY